MALQLDRLQEQREQAQIGQAELAQRAGVSLATVRRLEAGNLARVSTAVKLARALGMEWRELVADRPAQGTQGRSRG